VTSSLKVLVSVVCPLCGDGQPLPGGIHSPHFEDPATATTPAERARRQGLIAAWVDPIQQLLAAECQAIGTGSHEGVNVPEPRWFPYAP